MADRIEPQILLSRLMAFVFAAALVVLGVLVITLMNLFPLNRPQVFFLTSQPRDNLEIQIASLNPSTFDKDEKRLDAYLSSFIKEYVVTRNEIVPNAKIMTRKWTNQGGGAIDAWSTPDVYSQFTDTAMWNLIMQDELAHDLACNVEFATPAITPLTQNDTKDSINRSYTVNFSYFCTNNNGQTDRKDYTIVVTLETQPNTDRNKWADRMANPLGVRVSGYKITGGGGDPLDFD